MKPKKYDLTLFGQEIPLCYVKKSFSKALGTVKKINKGLGVA